VNWTDVKRRLKEYKSLFCADSMTLRPHIVVVVCNHAWR